jgi:endonuclease/exonuclease/phosphatase (EEP) superfamily protein YafD
VTAAFNAADIHSHIDRAFVFKKTLISFCCAMALSACRATGITQVEAFPASSSTLPDEISIVSWNVQKGASDQFRPDLERLIASQSPNLIFLQEATADALQSDQLGGYFAESWSYPWPNGKTIGMMTLSDASPETIEPLPSRYREFFITAPKLSLITRHRLSNDQVLLAVNIHLLTFERWGTMKLRAQLDQLKAIMTAHAGPIVFVGDFNSWNKKRLDLILELTRDLGLEEVTVFGSGRRTPDRGAFANWLLGLEKELALDRFFYRGFDFRDAEVLPYESSDHRPILVTLAMTE